MDDTTYNNPLVISLVSDLFIPVRVDTDQRPDIQARYLDHGWPTTSFLTPQGDILTAYGYLTAQDLTTRLQQVSQVYATNKQNFAEQFAQMYRQQAARQLEPAREVPTDTLDLALCQLADLYDPINGGFGQQPKFPAPAPLELIWRYVYTVPDTAWQERATRTLDGMRQLIDPIWGGIYRYSVSADWRTPHYEKMLAGNAAALQIYLEAYQATDRAAYRTAAEDIARYVEAFLADPAGGFYGSQDADLLEPDTRTILLDGETYFTLPDQERRARGLPHIDQNLYTNANGAMIAALLSAAAVLEQPRYQTLALAALERLWSESRGSQGQLWHSRPVGNARPGVMLADQTQFGLALLAAYSATGQRTYLARAEELADYLQDNLRDSRSGGFYDLSVDPGTTGALAVRATPCVENIQAARFFTRLYRHTDTTAYRDVAENVLRLCASETGSAFEYALAADDLVTYPLNLVVVGDPDQEAAAALRRAANRFYRPGKVVTPLDPALGPTQLGELTYPADRVALYACAQDRCSKPIQDPQELPDQVSQLYEAVP